MMLTAGNRPPLTAGGYSLLEVLIAMAIFAFGILAFTQLQGQLMRVNADARIRTLAANIAEEQIETQKRFTRLAAGEQGAAFAFEDISDSSTVVTRNGVEFTVAQTVTDYYWHEDTGQFSETAPDGKVFADFKQVDVAVSWDGMEFVRGDSSGATTGRLASGSVVLSTAISSRVTATNHLALIDELAIQELCVPLVNCPASPN